MVGHVPVIVYSGTKCMVAKLISACIEVISITEVLCMVPWWLNVIYPKSHVRIGSVSNATLQKWGL